MPENGKIYYLGVLPQDEVLEVLSRVDLLVAPNIGQGSLEGCGRVVIEATAAGVPAVISDPDCPPKEIRREKIGWTVRPNDVEALSNALVEALSDRNRLVAIGREAQEYTYRTFDPVRIVEETTKLYGEVVDARKKE